MQDILELYFGLQHACGFRSDNSTLHQFGYYDNAIRMKGSLSKSRVEGNTKGGQKQTRYSWHSVDKEKLSKRKKEI